MASLFVATALRLNVALSIPDFLMFFVTGSLLPVMFRIITIIPCFIIMAKTVPPGVEATMIALTMTIINLNLFLIGTPMGTIINSLFVHVTKEDLSHYYVLTIILLAFSFYPLCII